ncbi:MAG TPA: ABC transporter permease [Cyclobacteriaceae bacterium]|nr:ABC transporter permease [Cyclobacteriaceae bacterium]
MVRNYVRSGIRNARKNAGSFMINFFGLVIGFTCCGLISLYVINELSYDRYHENADRIYRVAYNEQTAETPGPRHLGTVGPPVGPALKQKYPQVEEAVRFRYTSERIVRVGEIQNYESKIYYADPSVFKVFSFPFIAGDRENALKLPNSVVLTEEMAHKYFGDEPALDKEILLDNNLPLKVTGVLKLPAATTLKFDFLLPFETFKVPFGYPVTLDSWGWISFHTYILLKPGTDAKALEAMLPEGFVKEHWSPENAKKFRFELQPITDIYLGDIHHGHDQVAAGNKTYISVLAVAGLVILLIAAFNFANLFAAMSASRAKEMGVRKVIGAGKSNVVIQLIGEAVVTSVVAAIVAICLLPLGSRLFPVESITVELIVAIIAVAVFTGLLAALYPSLVLGNFSHSKLLKGSFKTSAAGVAIRKSLVFAQFSISIILISSVFIISSQMEFLMNKDLGYKKDELMVLRMNGDAMRRYFPSLRTRLLQNPEITGVSIGGGRMDGDNGNVAIFTEADPDGKPMPIDAASFDFFKTIGIEMAAGREFTERQAADTLRGVIINQSAARAFGWTDEDAIGKKIRIGEIVRDGEVIGVVPDFHFGPLRNAIQPLVISFPRTRLQDIYVRFQADNTNALLSSVRESWNTIAPELPFDYIFLGDHLTGLYKPEKFFSMLFNFFAVAAIAIACLGLYGLVSQDVVYRVREIGIRKVFGASVLGISMLIVKRFLIIVLIANVVAWPVCWMIMEQWLDQFSYHVDLNVYVFPMAGLGTAAMALLSVSFKTIAAAMANPMKSLRVE